MDAKEKEQIIKSRQDYEKSEIKVINKDFYGDLPSQVCSVLDGISWHWKKYDWFEEAWNKYRDHVLSSVSNGNPIKAPGFIFNSYIDEQVAADFDKEFAERYPNEKGMCECMHSEENLDDFLAHANMDATGRLHDDNSGRFVRKDGSESEEVKKAAEAEKKQKKDQLEFLKTENELRKNIKEYNDNLPAEVAKREKAKATEEQYKNSVDMLKAGRDITNELVNMTREVPGTKRVNPKETKIKDDRLYKDISDEELSKRVRRMQLERQYGDLSGDTKYIQTGKEQTRERLQTIGSLLGIAISALTLYKFLHKDK